MPVSVFTVNKELSSPESIVSLIVECALECEWADGAQTTLTGTANTDVDSLRDLLDEIMGTEVVELRMPDRVYAFERSRYGANALCVHSRVPDGHDL